MGKKANRRRIGPLSVMHIAPTGRENSDAFNNTMKKYL
jgi:hypothetical protein